MDNQVLLAAFKFHYDNSFKYLSETEKMNYMLMLDEKIFYNYEMHKYILKRATEELIEPKREYTVSHIPTKIIPQVRIIKRVHTGK